MNTDVTGKVTAPRLRRDAYLYIRQSTLYQVASNTESTPIAKLVRLHSGEIRQFQDGLSRHRVRDHLAVVSQDPARHGVPSDLAGEAGPCGASRNARDARVPTATNAVRKGRRPSARGREASDAR